MYGGKEVPEDIHKYERYRIFCPGVPAYGNSIFRPGVEVFNMITAG
jgi:hypothetical protein